MNTISINENLQVMFTCFLKYGAEETKCNYGFSDLPSRIRSNL